MNEVVLVDQERKCIKKAANILYAYIYIENADPDKYRSVLKTLNQQKLFGNNQFPKTIIEANAILSNHNYEMSKNRNNERNANKTEGIKNENNEDFNTSTLSFAQIEFTVIVVATKATGQINAN